MIAVRLLSILNFAGQYGDQFFIVYFTVVKELVDLYSAVFGYEG